VACTCGALAASLWRRPRDLGPALISTRRAPVGRVVWIPGNRPAGIRSLQRAIMEGPAGEREVLIVSRAGFTEGARALAANVAGVRLYAGPRFARAIGVGDRIRDEG